MSTASTAREKPLSTQFRSAARVGDGLVTAPTGHLAPDLTTADIVPALGTVTSVSHGYPGGPGRGLRALALAVQVLRKGEF